MASEDAFGARLALRLRPMVPRKYSIETKRSLLYAISFDDQGELQLGQNSALEPTRGGGTGFEQDLLLFERAPGGKTAIIPRVSVELKFGGVSTHDSIVYSEKARRIRAIYPFVRYGLILGGLDHIPGRTLRLGTEFDFIVAMPTPIREPMLGRVAKLLRVELRLSRKLTDILRGRDKVAALHRSLRYSRKF
jgi:hypothetical protein